MLALEHVFTNNTHTNTKIRRNKIKNMGVNLAPDKFDRPIYDNFSYWYGKRWYLTQMNLFRPSQTCPYSEPWKRWIQHTSRTTSTSPTKPQLNSPGSKHSHTTKSKQRPKIAKTWRMISMAILFSSQTVPKWYIEKYILAFQFIEEQETTTCRKIIHEYSNRSLIWSHL